METSAVQDSLKVDPKFRQVLYPKLRQDCCTRQFKGVPQIETSAVQDSLKVDPKFRQVLYKTV